MTADTFLLSDTHHDESTACQVKSILLHLISISERSPGAACGTGGASEDARPGGSTGTSHAPRRQTRDGRGAGARVPPVDYRDELRLAWPQLRPQPFDSLPQSRAVAPIFRDKTRRPGSDPASRRSAPTATRARAAAAAAAAHPSAWPPYGRSRASAATTSPRWPRSPQTAPPSPGRCDRSPPNQPPGPAGPVNRALPLDAGPQPQPAS